MVKLLWAKSHGKEYVKTLSFIITRFRFKTFLTPCFQAKIGKLCTKWMENYYFFYCFTVVSQGALHHKKVSTR